MELDATNKWPGETQREWGRTIAMDAAVQARICGGVSRHPANVLVCRTPAFAVVARGAGCRSRFYPLSVTQGLKNQVKTGRVEHAVKPSINLHRTGRGDLR